MNTVVLSWCSLYWRRSFRNRGQRNDKHAVRGPAVDEHDLLSPSRETVAVHSPGRPERGAAGDTFGVRWTTAGANANQERFTY